MKVVVESELAIFTIGKIHENGLVSMDKDKPYVIKEESKPMKKCVEGGHYAVIVPLLCLAVIKILRIA